MKEKLSLFFQLGKSMAKAKRTITSCFIALSVIFCCACSGGPINSSISSSTDASSSSDKETIPEKDPETEDIAMSSLKTLRSLSGTDALGREVTPVASLSEPSGV